MDSSVSPAEQILQAANMYGLLDQTDGSFIPVIPPHVVVQKLGFKTLSPSDIRQTLSIGCCFAEPEVEKIVRFMTVRTKHVPNLIRYFGSPSLTREEVPTGPPRADSEFAPLGPMILRCLGADGERIDMAASSVLFPNEYHGKSGRENLYAAVAALTIKSCGWLSATQNISGMPGMQLQFDFVQRALHTCRRAISLSLFACWEEHHHSKFPQLLVNRSSTKLGSVVFGEFLWLALNTVPFDFVIPGIPRVKRKVLVKDSVGLALDRTPYPSNFEYFFVDNFVDIIMPDELRFYEFAEADYQRIKSNADAHFLAIRDANEAAKDSGASKEKSGEDKSKGVLKKGEQKSLGQLVMEILGTDYIPPRKELMWQRILRRKQYEFAQKKGWGRDQAAIAICLSHWRMAESVKLRKKRSKRMLRMAIRIVLFVVRYRQKQALREALESGVAPQANLEQKQFVRDTQKKIKHILRDMHMKRKAKKARARAAKGKKSASDRIWQLAADGEERRKAARVTHKTYHSVAPALISSGAFRVNEFEATRLGELRLQARTLREGSREAPNKNHNPPVAPPSQDPELYRRASLVPLSQLFLGPVMIDGSPPASVPLLGDPLIDEGMLEGLPPGVCVDDSSASESDVGVENLTLKPGEVERERKPVQAINVISEAADALAEGMQRRSSQVGVTGKTESSGGLLLPPAAQQSRRGSVAVKDSAGMRRGSTAMNSPEARRGSVSARARDKRGSVVIHDTWETEATERRGSALNTGEMEADARRGSMAHLSITAIKTTEQRARRASGILETRRASVLLESSPDVMIVCTDGGPPNSPDLGPSKNPPVPFPPSVHSRMGTDKDAGAQEDSGGAKSSRKSELTDDDPRWFPPEFEIAKAKEASAGEEDKQNRYAHVPVDPVTGRGRKWNARQTSGLGPREADKMPVEVKYRQLLHRLADQTSKLHHLRIEIPRNSLRPASAALGAPKKFARSGETSTFTGASSRRSRSPTLPVDFEGSTADLQSHVARPSTAMAAARRQRDQQEERRQERTDAALRPFLKHTNRLAYAYEVNANVQAWCSPELSRVPSRRGTTAALGKSMSAVNVLGGAVVPSVGGQKAVSHMPTTKVRV
uniref:Uncharacterized protein n=1 Tax=Chromera velia CCMP2878 TaxID=1169474 RepID=A0A0G4FLV7_9ALVE|eukprot:Cvel_17646.t1-p1 / transcript=Cvel_17646.t1 / gene=Cvel_17646 / organism=Chromera_velia_CCMP2878 / gene_product=hypothetical protein / transcript_product=hypothetical protein / location=Cvel_scaffold1421:13707-21591(+) / protein_length=1109 / sequence_SO=supercontig / SO=protein_coding / is_pseudo=false